VALVNEAAARAFWPDEDPLGKVIHPDVDITGRDPTSFEVVGVVGDVRDVALDAAPSPIIYVPHTQQTWPTMTFAVRAAGDPSALVPTVRMIVNELTHEATFSFQRLDEVLRYSTAERRLITTVIGLFGIIALVLAAVGTFGLLSHSVSTRTRELAVRRALGADETGVLRIVVLEGGALIFAGMALGIPGSLGVSRLVSGLLYGVGPMDPKAYLAACGVLGLSGIVATFLPARRAMRIHPTVALRHE
jgi:putative ABC transport system permease protein